MLPGPGVAEISGGVAVGCRISVSRGSTVTVVGLPAWDVVLDATSSRTTKRQVSFTCSSEYVPSAPLDSVNNYGHRCHVLQVVETPDGARTEIDFGFFLIESWAEQPGSGTMTVSAVDLLRLVETDVAAWPSSPPKGQRLRAELQRLAGTTLAIQYDGPDETVDSELQFQTDRLANLADLCAAHGLDYGMRPDGYLHFWKLNNTPVAAYTARDLIVESPRESAPRKPNRYLAVGSKTEGSGDKAKETRWSFEASMTAEPYGQAYGIVRERLEVQAATSQSMVTTAANNAMKQGVSVLGSRSLEMVPDSRLELGDVATFTPAEGSPFVGRVTAFSLPLDRPSLQRVDVEIIG